MSGPHSDKVFDGSIPALYETHLVPLIFEPYAADLANRLASRPITSVLELAAGTGVLTRALASVLPERVSVVATDLNQPMLDHAARLGTARPVEWRQADAMQLPFPDASFDAIACQFGVMFFPDKAKAFAETRRVLKPRGVFMFNVWDRIEDNEFADTITTALESLYPDDPPRFLARTPHGYHDPAAIERDLAGLSSLREVFGIGTTFGTHDATADVHVPGIEVDVVPLQSAHLAGSGAGDTGEAHIGSEVAILGGNKGDEPLHLLGGRRGDHRLRNRRRFRQRRDVDRDPPPTSTL